MIFREAGKRDIENLVEMRKAYLSEDHGGLACQEIQALENLLPAYFHRHIGEDFIAFIAAEDGEILATVFMVIIEKPANPNFLTGKTGTILNVYTKPQYRRKGFASKLLQMAVQKAKERELSFLELQATREGETLYRKLGFVQEDTKYISMKYRV